MIPSDKRPGVSIRRGQALAFTVPGLLAASLQASADPVRFNPGFLYPGTAGTAALAALEQGNTLSPGRHTVRLLVNREDLGQHVVSFEADAQGNVQPCLSAAWLQTFGLRLETVHDPALLHPACIDLPAAVPAATAQLDARDMTLSLSLPQAFMRREASGYVDPARWDDGINAGFINYQASAQRGSGQTSRRASEDVLLTTGLNMGPWQLRGGFNLRSNEHERRWLRNYTYLRRDVPGLNANITVGEASTGGDVFSSQPILGAVLASDMGMLPDSLQAYAPVIRGVALSRAKVEVRQNGYTVYNSYVSAGPFTLDDLAISGNGELEIIVTEADGQVRRFTQPYATLGNLLRQGTWRYEGSIGRYNPSYTALGQPLLAQASLARGLAWNTTLYGGVRHADFYQASTLGAARDLGRWGALAADVTLSRSQSATGDGLHGQSYAVRYGKAFRTRTYLRFAGYRYSTENYRDFNEAVYEHSRYAGFGGNRRSRFEASLNQPLGRSTSTALTLSQEDYWGDRPSRRQFHFSVSTSHRSVQYSAYATQSLTHYSGQAHNDRQFGVAVSIPLDFGNWSTVSLDGLRSQNQWSRRATFSTLDQERGLNYSASLAQSGQAPTNAAASVGYQGQWGSYSLGYSSGQDYRSLSASASGSLVVHRDGIVLGSIAGDTMALVHVPGIEGVGVANSGRTLTNADGYSVVPYLRPYRVNTVTLETSRLGPDVEIENGAQQVVPRRGAIVRAGFEARKVNRLILQVVDRSGAPLPFGTQAMAANGDVLGMVGQGGQLLLATSLDQQTLTLARESEERPCTLPLTPAAWPERDGFRQQRLICDSTL
ncbi:fimbria/pilus outer membrane usher protein [Pseudomonas sp. Marseille-Q5115]|uniref:fimbria/pilus outer membrane usher protein n=1 Tax=Pseudomonas sp. Marseille-Q5115 TaxID=2866593 RepID=UPI001CE3FFBD|nr:fimbria/pilus outer membrane usher protein [Pseudomonas sp. Marseille-Q5115]